MKKGCKIIFSKQAHPTSVEYEILMLYFRAFNHELSLGAIQPRGRQITSSPGPFGGYGGPQATPLSSTQSAFIPNASSAFTTPVSPYRNNSAQIIAPGPIQQVKS